MTAIQYFTRRSRSGGMSRAPFFPFSIVGLGKINKEMGSPFDMISRVYFY